jgi:hypothetical protein
VLASIIRGLVRDQTPVQEVLTNVYKLNSITERKGGLGLQSHTRRGSGREGEGSQAKSLFPFLVRINYKLENIIFIVPNRMYMKIMMIKIYTPNFVEIKLIL